jgi:hypothetical protein
VSNVTPWETRWVAGLRVLSDFRQKEMEFTESDLKVICRNSESYLGSETINSDQTLGHTADRGMVTWDGIHCITLHIHVASKHKLILCGNKCSVISYDDIDDVDRNTPLATDSS